MLFSPEIQLKREFSGKRTLRGYEVTMNKYGKLLLSAYIMERIKNENSRKNSGLLKKYAKLALGAYIVKKLKSAKSENKEEMLETEELELSEEASKVKGHKHLATGAFAGASGILIGVIGALAGVAILYAAKKKMDERHKHQVAVK